jgi:perosamine synthetase
MNQVTNLSEQIVEAIRSVAGTGSAALHEPSFRGNEWLYVKECLDSSYVSSVGKFVDRFEHDLASFAGCSYAVAVVNGTAALHIALMVAGVIPGDEVLIPTLTFVATANAVVYCNASPHFVDIEFSTLGIDCLKLREYLQANTEQRQGQCVNLATGKVIRALVPMHTFGHPGQLDALIEVAHDFNLTLVEDAAESLGSTYKGKHTGTFGLLGALSFNGNKIITTGGGGAILTNNPAIARYAKHLTTTAKIIHPWDYRHDRIGYNYRLPNLNAALGCAQLEQLPVLLAAKRKLFLNYKTAFLHVCGATLFTEPDNCSSNYWLQTIVLDKNQIDQRDEILLATNKAGLSTRPAWTLIHKLEPYKNFPRMDTSTAESLSERLINIPSSADLVSKLK